MQKSSILLLISALCLAGANVVTSGPHNCLNKYNKYVGAKNLPIKDDCESYIDCFDFSGQVKKCPSGQILDSRTGICSGSLFATCQPMITDDSSDPDVLDPNGDTGPFPGAEPFLSGGPKT